MITPPQAVTAGRAWRAAANRSRGAWPAAIVLLGWLILWAALVAGYAPGGPYDAALPLLVAVPPAALAGVGVWRAARGREPSASWRWRAGLVMAIGAGLVLAPLSWTLAGGGGLPPGWSGPQAQRLLPGQGEAWAYLVALGLTAGATVPPRRVGAAFAIAVLAAGAVGGGLALTGNAAALGPDQGAGTAACTDEIVLVGGTQVRSAGWGELDGKPLGSAELVHSDAVPATARYDTRWGSGTARLGGVGPAYVNPFYSANLGSAERLGADDLGIELVSGVPARHCQVVVDGQTAVQMFPVLRWLSGSDWDATDAGAGLELWRGLLDYWVVDLLTYAPSPTTTVVLAAVSVDGQPPDWPFPGLHATLRAVTSFGD